MMATIALSRPVASHRPSSLTSAITLDSHPSQCPAPVPNKHIPVCPPGPIPQQEPTTPPPSPVKEEDQLTRSLLYPPDKYASVEMGRLSLYKVDTDDVAAALDHLARQPMPDPAQVFPWLHGLHPANAIQQAFFMARKRALRKTPPCLRGITLVKADGELNVARLKGAIAPHEFLQLGGPVAEFLDVDPKDGFSVRNFQIQAAKSAMTSDIIIYGDDDVAVRKLGWNVAAAQQRWRDRHEAQRHHLPWYNTFICVSPFAEFEEKHPEIVSVNSAGLLTGNVLDFFHQERREMYDMTQASEISRNVWLGPTPDAGSEEEQSYDVLIECSDLGRLNPAALQAISELADDETKQYHLDFPSSGSILPPTWSHAEADGILETCKWLYHLSHGTRPPPPTQPTEHPPPDTDTDGDTPMTTATPPPNIRPRKILLHCNDGYTESTMLAVAYHSYASGLPAPTAWLDLHTTHRRNIFAYPSDVGLLSAIAPRLLRSSPATTNPHNIPLSDLATMLQQHEPRWFTGFDGSFPSRVLEYMYLGNLGHANNPDLLRALGIGQILSVGEQAMWRDGELEEWGVDNVCLVKGVQDNGIDSLMDEFERCLEFIGTCFWLSLDPLFPTSFYFPASSLYIPHFSHFPNSSSLSLTPAVPPYPHPPSPSTSKRKHQATQTKLTN
jgi:dual specificity MAP kinase phosphatase